MTSTPETPAGDGADLAALRDEIDALKATPTEQLIDPEPTELLEEDLVPTPTEAMGTEKWDGPVDDEADDA